MINCDSYHFMSIHVKNEKGETDNEKYFIGRLPKVGEAVEIIYTGNDAQGAMEFQLRVSAAEQGYARYAD